MRQLRPLIGQQVTKQLPAVYECLITSAFSAYFVFIFYYIFYNVVLMLYDFSLPNAGE